MKTDKYEIFFYILIFVLLLLLVASARAQTSEAQPTGGSYTMTKMVVAGGGRDAQNAAMTVSATAGQPIAGRTSTGAQFSLYSGFWTPESFAPTAATVSVGGRVMTADGRGIRNAHVTVTFPNGETRSTLTGESGRFNFNDIEVGGTYIFAVTSKRFRFSSPTQVLTILEERSDVIFVADN